MTEPESARSIRRWRNRFGVHGRKLTTVVVAWLLAVVAAAGYLLARPDPPPPVSPTAATTVSNRLYVDPNSQAAAWVRAHPGSSLAKEIAQRIADQPTAKWFGAWSGDITSAVSSYTAAAAQEHKVPVLVAYNLPNRDCGGYSSGGVADAQAYETWIDDFAAGLDNRRAVVILEPDSLALMDGGCLDSAARRARFAMLSRAVDRLESKNVWVYLDAGHSSWVPADQMAKRLEKANIAHAHGFSLNVSNYMPTSDETAYAGQVNSALGRVKPFVIDTSRNGNGSQNGQWCNPAGTRLGTPPGLSSGPEMLLWLKAPGESDGDCGMAPGTAAGQFVPKLAKELISGS